MKIDIEVRGDTYDHRELLKKSGFKWNGKTWDNMFAVEFNTPPTKEDMQNAARKILGLTGKALRGCQIIINCAYTITSVSYTGPKYVRPSCSQSDGGTESDFWS